MPSKKYQTGKHLEAFLLLLIRLHPDHGGSLMARLSKTLPEGWVIDSGRVYRLLRDLERNGAVASRWMTGEVGTPTREYVITADGEARLQSFAEEMRLRRDSLERFLHLWRQETDDT